jgi:predicted phosphatase
MAGRPSNKNKDSEKKTTENNNEEIKLENKPKAVTTKIRKDIPLNTLVACRSTVKGRLTYISKRQMGLEVIWEDFGAVEWMELGELVSLKNSYPRFFKDAWLAIDDMEIVEYLGIQKYMENLIDLDNIDDVFLNSPEELENVLIKLPSGLKDTIIQRARELMATKEFDSISRIEVIEKVYGVDLRI